MATNRADELEQEILNMRSQLERAEIKKQKLVKSCSDMGLEIQMDDNRVAGISSSKGLAEQNMSRESREDSDCISLGPEAEDLDEVMKAASESEKSFGGYSVGPRTNKAVISGSALALRKPAQALIYLIAVGGLVFVLIAKSEKLGAKTDPTHRMLGGGASPLMTNIAFCVCCAGLIAFIVNLLKQPLIVGYLLGGVLVGPQCLDIVHSHLEMTDISSLGLVFLLFMIGLELDLTALRSMNKIAIFTGIFQVPVCSAIMALIFAALDSAGLSFGNGKYSVVYCGTTCAISSTVLVVKLLSEQAEMDSSPGRFTVGILIFQDIWAIVLLAIQPDLANPQAKHILETFGLIVLLIVVALAYAKIVMPAVFVASNKSVELMLILSLAWCFWLCCLAILPFIGLSMELASIIAGAALATFPYSDEFNGKIKYIRDFFITLYFVTLGMQVPTPKLEIIGKALTVVAVVLVVRWIGIFLVIRLVGGAKRLAGLATINLSQISELSLVICSMGLQYNHVDEETFTIMIWSFCILAVLGSYMIKFNYTIYGKLAALMRAMRKQTSSKNSEDEDGGHADRDIIILGFHKIAAMLVAHFEYHSHHLLEKIHVIDFHESLKPQLERRGVMCEHCDISAVEDLKRCHRGDVRLVISSIPDSMLRGVSNLRLLQVSKQVWPTADVIVTADTPYQAHELYEHGADYVLRMAKLCAERLHDVIVDHTTHFTHHHEIGEDFELGHVFDEYKHKDSEKIDTIHINV